MPENKHIVVREDGGCLCGRYEVGPMKEPKSIGCSDIIEITDRLPYRLDKEKFIDDCNTIKAVIEAHVKVCE